MCVWVCVGVCVCVWVCVGVGVCVWVCACVCVCVSTSLSLAGVTFGLPYPGKAQQQHPQEQRYPFLSVCAVFSCVPTMVSFLAATRAALPIPISVCSIFVCPNNGIIFSSHKSSATHSYQCVQYFRVSQQWYGSQGWGF